MDLGRFAVAEKRIVATHVVIINWLSQKSYGPFEEKLLSLESFPELMQTKSGMKKSGAAKWRDLAKLAADRQSTHPFFLPHQMIKSQLQNFGAILGRYFDGI